LLLLSSDDRPRYAEDIQTVLALPNGAIIEFRYRMRWVAPALQEAVRHQEVVGAVAVLGFVGADRHHEPFVLPVRYATVAEVELVADMVIFQLRVRGYPNLDLYPRSFEEIVEMSRGVIGQLKRREKFYPATSSFPAMPDEILADAAHRWLSAVRLLALHPTFKDSYFLRVASVETTRRKLRFDAEGKIAIAGDESLRITTYFFATHYSPDGDFKLTCSTDGANLRVASDNVYHVALRYDSVEFWIQPAGQNYDTSSLVSISLASEKAGALTIAANVRLSLVVRRSRSRTLRRWAVVSAGAVLVGLMGRCARGGGLRLWLCPGRGGRLRVREGRLGRGLRGGLGGLCRRGR
jgi:hypothetical protein